MSKRSETLRQLFWGGRILWIKKRSRHMLHSSCFAQLGFWQDVGRGRREKFIEVVLKRRRCGGEALCPARPTWPCQVGPVSLGCSPACQRLLLFFCSLTLSQPNSGKYDDFFFFIIPLAQGFMPSIKFVSTEARCAERVGTLRAQRTSPMPDIFIIKLERRKWLRIELFFFFLIFKFC